MKLIQAKDKLANKTSARQFQCTYRSCGTIITRLGQYLTRTHQDTKLLAQVKAACIRLPTAKTPTPAAPKPKPKSARKPSAQTKDSTSSDDDNSFSSGESMTTTNDTPTQACDHYQSKIEADLDEINSYVASDAEDEDEEVTSAADNTWRAAYLS